jgi:hypothetical protein
MQYIRSVSNSTNDDTMKITICPVSSISNNNAAMETIQHPAVKKIKIKPGNANSVIKKTTPTRNHINDGEILSNDISPVKII